MDWNGNLRSVPFVVSRPENSFSFLYNYNYHDQFQGLEMKQALMPSSSTQQAIVPSIMDSSHDHHQDVKKKRLSTEQLESLENSFQEEIKLDPDRKMKLAKELGLQPRQIAVWFQNRRARWKGKQLERLYHALKLEFDAVSREKHKLQHEVLALRAMLLKDQVVAIKEKQISTNNINNYTEVSGEETVESTSIPSSDIKKPNINNVNNQFAADQCSSYHVLDVDDYNPVMTMMTTTAPYNNNWATLPN